MPDREKVIKGLECLAQKQAPTANPCKGCGYINRPNFAICVKDIASDALSLLKEQESIKPLLTGHGEYETEGSWWYECGNCGTPIDPDDNFCRKCGKAVKWE